MTWVAGVDGFKSRWFAILQNLETQRLETRIVSTFAELLVLGERPTIVAVDIPIGLPEVAARGGRACEKQARIVLGARRSSVFNAVGRDALKAESREEADRRSRAGGGIGIGAQAWGLASKLREVDKAMYAQAQATVREVHPEVSFWALNDEVPMAFSKKSAAGERERQAALVRVGFPKLFIDGMGSELRVGRDDFLDACAALWTAKRIADGKACRFPTSSDFDRRGMDQAIWF